MPLGLVLYVVICGFVYEIVELMLIGNSETLHSLVMSAGRIMAWMGALSGG